MVKTKVNSGQHKLFCYSGVSQVNLNSLVIHYFLTKMQRITNMMHYYRLFFESALQLMGPIHTYTC